MKTTSEITQEHKKFLSSVNNMPMKIYLEKANKKWYSEEELRKKISECYSFRHANTTVAYIQNGNDNLICIEELFNKLFGDDKHDKRSMD